ncbi:MAG TPA: YHS domain-containing protein, partial [Vicinamibacterales bacterium]|nr:YHS domain-containing protein [Vicinamibacterales bacterium]
MNQPITLIKKSDGAVLKDVVCGMRVSPDSPHQIDYKGTRYAFCSAGCLKKFQQDPERYLSPGAPPPQGMHHHEPPRVDVAPARPGGKWTCPMHPEIVRDGPGSCPICGMALEPMTVSVEEPENVELVDMTRRFKVSTALTVPLVLIAMRDLIPGQPLDQALTPTRLAWVELLLATPVVVWGGWPFFVRGWESLVNRNLNMFTLIAMGVGVAYDYSVIATLVPGIFPASFRGHHGTVDVYFEAAAVIVTLVLLGQVLELRARSRTGAAIRALLGLAPKTARRVRDG